jgi:hypothetical protein
MSAPHGTYRDSDPGNTRGTTLFPGVGEHRETRPLCAHMFAGQTPNSVFRTGRGTPRNAVFPRPRPFRAGTGNGNRDDRRNP